MNKATNPNNKKGAALAKSNFIWLTFDLGNDPVASVEETKVDKDRAKSAGRPKSAAKKEATNVKESHVSEVSHSA